MKQNRACTNPCCQSHGSEDISPVTGLIVRRIRSAIRVINGTVIEDPCLACNDGRCEVTYRWGTQGPLPFLCFPLADCGENNCKEEDVPTSAVVLEHKYDTFAFTRHKSTHFQTVFMWKNHKYIYDGLEPQALKSYCKSNESRVSTVWLKKRFA